jgi:hypothetical protein
VWKAKEISTKMKIFSGNVKFVLLYGFETWKVTKENYKLCRHLSADVKKKPSHLLAYGCYK